MAKKETISVIIPTKNQEAKIDDTMRDLIKKEKEMPYDLEVVFVNDRSDDKSPEIADEYGKKLSNYKRIDTPSDYVGNGKGLAVKMGMAEASGDYKMFMDADSSVRFIDIDNFYPYIGKYPLVLGNRYSKEAREPETNWFKAVWVGFWDVIHVLVFGSSKYYEAKKKQGRFRQLVARGANFVYTFFLGQNFSDQRCGFKLFSKEAADDMFPRVNVLTWDFETEIFAMAKKYGYKAIQVPVTYIDDEEDSNFKIRDIYNGFKVIFLVYWHSLRGDYKRKKKS